MRTAAAVVFLLAMVVGPCPRAAWGQFLLPELPEPHEFGTVLIDRGSTAAKVEPVAFPHWSHRIDYSCRVCHFELEFEFELNTTEITEEDNKNGRYCGACHDGTTAFGHTEENCGRCHSGKLPSDKKSFKQATAKFPKAEYGNNVDWSRAVSDGVIAPTYSIFVENEKPYDFDELLLLEAEWNFVPPSHFPHAAHAVWLDCANCHPDVFNVKKKTTEHFEMKYILDGKFCGVCHMDVAFPIDDCRRCHPDMRAR